MRAGAQQADLLHAGDGQGGTDGRGLGKFRALVGQLGTEVRRLGCLHPGPGGGGHQVT